MSINVAFIGLSFKYACHSFLPCEKCIFVRRKTQLCKFEYPLGIFTIGHPWRKDMNAKSNKNELHNLTDSKHQHQNSVWATAGRWRVEQVQGFIQFSRVSLDQVSHQYFYWFSILKQTAASWTNHRKVDFNEFVQNSLCCDIGMIIFVLHGYEGCQRPKTLALLTQRSVHPTVPVLLTKRNKKQFTNK